MHERKEGRKGGRKRETEKGRGKEGQQTETLEAIILEVSKIKNIYEATDSVSSQNTKQDK